MTAALSDALLRSLAWEHERVELVHDHPSGLSAVIAIHSTVLGPALAGQRPARARITSSASTRERLERAGTAHLRHRARWPGATGLTGWLQVLASLGRCWPVTPGRSACSDSRVDELHGHRTLADRCGAALGRA